MLASRMFLLLAVLSPLCSLDAADSWPEFRGPHGDGRVENSHLPTRWSETEHVRFKTRLPGRGWSTPVIVRDRIWMSSATEDGRELFALCINRNSGKLLSRVKLFEVEHPAPRNKLNSYASPSPVTDGRRVYLYFGTYGMAALDAESGRTIWTRRDLKLDHQEGPGSSPILYDGKLIVHCDGRDVQYLVAIDCETGETVWKRKRSIDLSKVGDYARKAFTTPLVVATDEGDRLISPAAQGCYGYDPTNGREIWRVRYPGFSAVPRPVAAKGLAFVVDGFAKPKIYAIRYDGQGDVSDSHVAWIYSQNGPSTPSPVVLDDQLLFISDKGILSSVNVETGKQLWRRRIGGNFCASPIVANGLVYLFDRAGKTTIIRAGNSPQVVAVNELDEGLMASPAVAGNALFLRTSSFLYCLEK